MSSANKRQRQSGDDNPTSTTPPKPKTPIRAGEAAIDTFVESLREEVRPILAKTAKSYLRDLITGHSKMETFSRIKNDPDFIPRSARINFEIKSNKETSELDALQALKDETDVIVKETREKLRKKIIKSLEIEITNRADKLAKDSVKAANLCAMIAMAEKDTDKKFEVKVTRETYENTIAAISESSTVEQARLQTALDDLHPDLSIEMDTDSEDEAALSAHPSAPAATVARSREMFTAIFIVPVREWKKATEDQKVRNRLLAITNADKKKATAAAAIVVEAEPNVSETKLADLIKEAVSKETAALRKELERVKREKNESHPKGSRRRRSGASEKQKQSKKNTKKKVSFKPSHESADDADSASSKRKGILRPGRYQRSPSPKSKQSQGKKNGRNGRRQKK